MRTRLRASYSRRRASILLAIFCSELEPLSRSRVGSSKNTAFTANDRDQSESGLIDARMATSTDRAGSRSEAAAR